MHLVSPENIIEDIKNEFPHISVKAGTRGFAMRFNGHEAIFTHDMMRAPDFKEQVDIVATILETREAPEL